MAREEMLSQLKGMGKAMRKVLCHGTPRWHSSTFTYLHTLPHSSAHPRLIFGTKQGRLMGRSWVGGCMHCQWDVSPNIRGVCMAYSQTFSCWGYEPPHPNPAELGWAKKGHVLLSSSSLWFLIKHRCSGHLFKNKFDLGNHHLGELKMVLLMKSPHYCSPTPSPHSPPSFFPSLQEGGVQNHQIKPERVPSTFPLSSQLNIGLFKLCITYLKILLEEGHIFLIFTKANVLAVALFELGSESKSQ